MKDNKICISAAEWDRLFGSKGTVVPEMVMKRVVIVEDMGGPGEEDNTCGPESKNHE